MTLRRLRHFWWSLAPRARYRWLMLRQVRTESQSIYQRRRSTMGVDILKGEHGAFLYCNTTDLPLMTELFSEPEEAEKFLDWWNREQGGYGEESDLRNLTPRELAEVRSDWDRRRRDNEQS